MRPFASSRRPTRLATVDNNIGWSNSGRLQRSGVDVCGRAQILVVETGQTEARSGSLAMRGAVNRGPAVRQLAGHCDCDPWRAPPPNAFDSSWPTFTRPRALQLAILLLATVVQRPN